MPVCACCGLKITSASHETDRGYICDRCWNDSNLFFPEKFRDSTQWEEVSGLLDFKSDKTEKLNLPVLKLKQKKVTLYTGKIGAKDILRLYAVFGFEEETLAGYQRELYEDKVNEVYRYLLDCPVAVMPGIFLSVREGVKYIPLSRNESPETNDFGLLEVPMRRGAIWIIDGQHRVAGLERVISDVGLLQNNEDSDGFSSLSLIEYELPATFIDSQAAVEVVNSSEPAKMTAADIERLIFFMVNKTQKRISPSLKDALQYCIRQAGMNGIPVLEKESWRADATGIAIDFNASYDSPFYKKINISGQKLQNKPIQLNSFVSSLRPLFGSKDFADLSAVEKKELLLLYWKAIEQINKSAFCDGTYKYYMILRALGVYSINLLLLDYIGLCRERVVDICDESNIRGFVERMKGFDWSKVSSQIVHFGGMSGVVETRRVLFNYMFGTEAQVRCEE